MVLGQQKRRDYIDNVRLRDRPPAVDIAGSIREMRKIYKEYDDAEFAAWYGVRYGVSREAILAVIKADKAKEAASNGKA